MSAVIIGACKREPGKGGEESVDKIAPDHFNYETTKKVAVNIRVLAPNGDPIKGAKVQITSGAKADSSASLLTSMSDDAGYVKGDITVPSYLDTVIVMPNYIGVPNNVRVLVKDNAISAILGGPDGVSGNVVLVQRPSFLKFASLNSPRFLAEDDNIAYEYPGNASLQDAVEQPSGKPKYLDKDRDPINANLLSFINNSLPEGRSVVSHHNEFLSNSAISSLNIVADNTDVFLTFVYENASYLNTVGWYKYRTNDPPTKLKDIKTVTMAFPNASSTGDGGGLVSGQRVKIGNFDKGWSIGFVLIANGWTAESSNYYKVSTGKNKYFSNAVLNPESNAKNKKHSVLLYDDLNDVFVVGFEDLNRQNSNANEWGLVSDHDFNDLVLYAKAANGAISKTGVTEIDKGSDKDNDNVPDSMDEFPSDPKRAYTATTGWSTLAFEDQWPKTADYDLNDLVVNYRYKFTSNALNNIVDMTGEFTVLAVGAAYENGFGVEFPFSPSLVSKVTGQKHIKSYIQKAANGLEAGQPKAVIIPFDNYKALINNYGGAYFVNTKPSMEKDAGDTAKVYIVFTSPVSLSTLGAAPFNPFIICNMKRGYEVHLPGYEPTAKVDKSLFRTEDDNSDPGAKRYYQTVSNWPWAINIAEPFAYPTEESPINKAYLKFLDWASSNGALYKDWYKNTSGTYRNSALIYSK